MYNLEVSIFLYALKCSRQQWHYLGYADRNLGLVRFLFFQRKIGSFTPCLLRSVWIDCLFLAQVSVLSKALPAAPTHSTKSLPMVLLMCCWHCMFAFLLPPTSSRGLFTWPPMIIITRYLLVPFSSSLVHDLPAFPTSPLQLTLLFFSNPGNSMFKAPIC